MGTSGDSLDFGKMEHGCKHYRRRCKIRAPCCNEIFHCRHCHNESTSNRHELCRHDVKRVICLICECEQPVAKVCANCGVNMGEYFCKVCKFYDDDTNKGQYHCDECGICRVGGRENFFHCQKCGSCYSIALLDKHLCIENSMRHHCPICYEYLFDSLQETSVLKCGHTIHKGCFQEMLNHSQYACPICSKSVCDMSSHWRKLDEERTRKVYLRFGLFKDDMSNKSIRAPLFAVSNCFDSSENIEATLMPSDYRYKVWILCNDCNEMSEVFFHIIGHKCSSCQSYNTRTVAPPHSDTQ